MASSANPSGAKNPPARQPPPARPRLPVSDASRICARWARSACRNLHWPHCDRMSAAGAWAKPRAKRRIVSADTPVISAACSGR